MLERMGEIREPCGAPTAMSIGSDVLNDAACCEPQADIFGKLYDSEGVDQHFVVGVVEEPLNIKL